MWAAEGQLFPTHFLPLVPHRFSEAQSAEGKTQWHPREQGCWRSWLGGLGVVLRFVAFVTFCNLVINLLNQWVTMFICGFLCFPLRAFGNPLTLGAKLEVGGIFRGGSFHPPNYLYILIYHSPPWDRTRTRAVSWFNLCAYGGSE